jgi:hypothetical protein
MITIVEHDIDCPLYVYSTIIIYSILQRLIASIVLALLSSAPGLDELLVLHNSLQYIQSLMTHCTRPESICYLLLALSNIAPAIVGSDAEIAMRMCFQVGCDVY